MKQVFQDALLWSRMNLLASCMLRAKAAVNDDSSLKTTKALAGPISVLIRLLRMADRLGNILSSFSGTERSLTDSTEPQLHRRALNGKNDMYVAVAKWRESLRAESLVLQSR